ncbi:DUF460 domain-containing protein [Infirmifilum sp. NZ]|uniref:DUF460 domain-containing protein n=1 Tax=Infirmifilum sp. NZ TaxID=2926850 RepID=UPI0027A78B70|nr:DUF460 domain-containing protein [Infirmifilum sp. NZ]UNQ72684.1 DUF460 domain-containing protein [Infirmifilum sp. NZ]
MSILRRVVGLDIVPGSSPQAGEPLFALALVEEGRVTLRMERVPLSEVLALVGERGVEAIAVDNIYELAGDFRGIAEVLRRVPGKTPRLVEVTRLGDEVVSVEALCVLTGLCRGKLSPVETAELLAFLASRGIGSEVLVFEEETRIRVGRGRVPGQGGMSRERYKRNIEQLVKRKVAEIREKLDKAGIDYDLFVRKGGWGVVGATFVVYAPRERLNGLVKPESGHDIFVEISPVRRESIEYRPLGATPKRSARSERYTIVGVDPGMTTGVAILDFSGSIVSVFSRRLLSRGQLVKLLLDFGHPAVIASDVSPAPAYVKKLASQLGALLFTPQRSLSVDEKRRLTSGYPQVENSHQRDALAAALKAFNEYREKFDAVEQEASKYGLSIPLDKAKLQVVKGLPVSLAVKEAAKEYLQLSTKEELALQDIAQGGAEEQLRFYRKLAERLLQENKALTLELREATKRVSELELTLKKLLSVRKTLGADAEKVKLDSRVEQLQREASHLKAKLQQLEDRVSELERILLGMAFSKYRLAIKLSWLVEKTRENEGTLQELSDNIVFIDKSYPLELVQDLVFKTLKAKDFQSSVIVVTRSSKEAETLRRAIPPEAQVISLEDIAQYFDIGPIVAFESKELANALARQTQGDISKIKGILEEYRRERLRLLKDLKESNLSA